MSVCDPDDELDAEEEKEEFDPTDHDPDAWVDMDEFKEQPAGRDADEDWEDYYRQ